MDWKYAIRSLIVTAGLLCVICTTASSYLAQLKETPPSKSLPSPYYLSDDVQYFPATPVPIADESVQFQSKEY